MSSSVAFGSKNFTTGQEAPSDGRPSFWKKSIDKKASNYVGKPVYGAQHPPLQVLSESGTQVTTPKKSNKNARSRNSFQDFEEKTIDAWDDAEDDLMDMTRIKKSLRDSQNPVPIQRPSAGSVSNVDGGTFSETRTSSRSRYVKEIQGPVVGNYGRVTGRQMSSYLNNSVPNTPSHLSGHRIGMSAPRGRGGGLRMVNKMASVQYGQLPVPDKESSKVDKFKSLLETPSINLDELRTLSWSGVPILYRPITWKLLSGYLPPILERQEPMMTRKRQEYHNFVEQYYDTRHQDEHQETYQQIHIDVPRMSPLIPLFQQELVQEIFERILYIWAIRHPASGYVQGINDLVTPFFVVFLTEHITPDSDVESYPVRELPESSLQRLEADCFWCFSKLLDGIQDNYTFAQPGIQTRINSLQELVSRVDNVLHRHLQRQNVQYLQFSFRWMNNLLMREMPLHCVIRLWDTYLAEPDGFASFHLYVCAAFLIKFSAQLQRERDFHGLMLLLQSLPTHDWTNEEIGLILAEAYRLQFMFANAPSHYRDQNPR